MKLAFAKVVSQSRNGSTIQLLGRSVHWRRDAGSTFACVWGSGRPHATRIDLSSGGFGACLALVASGVPAVSSGSRRSRAALPCALAGCLSPLGVSCPCLGHGLPVSLPAILPCSVAGSLSMHQGTSGRLYVRFVLEAVLASCPPRNCHQERVVAVPLTTVALFLNPPALSFACLLINAWRNPPSFGVASTWRRVFAAPLDSGLHH